MKRHTVLVLMLAVAVATVGNARQSAAQSSRIVSTPQWEQLKSLVGEWEGYTTEGGTKMPVHLRVRLTGDGSAVMHLLGEGTPHEMVTMFHMDDTELMATHYCGAHNQPRMKVKASADPKQIAFEFKDGTNIRPGDGYMRELTITLVDPDHHNETWGYGSTPGNVQPGTFYLSRVKAAATK